MASEEAREVLAITGRSPNVGWFAQDEATRHDAKRHLPDQTTDNRESCRQNIERSYLIGMDRSAIRPRSNWDSGRDHGAGRWLLVGPFASSQSRREGVCMAPYDR
jgi:hypothetical protein